MRWGYLARLSVAGAIFVAAIFSWGDAATADTLLASLACVTALLVTAGSAIYSERRAGALGRGFLYLQAVFDLLLVSTVVHLTGGLGSQFAALYILVIGSASILLPGGGGLLVTGLGLSLFLADGVLGHAGPLTVVTWLQFGVFGAVAAGSAYISARLQELGMGQEELAAELVQARLQASDILHNIRSGVMTVDGEGRLLYANAAAESLLGMGFVRSTGRRVLPAITAIAPELGRALERGVKDGARTTRAEGVITLGDRSFPVGVTTTLSELEGRGGVRRPTITAIFQDLSESKRLEALHLRAERLEAVAALSASLAHEIRNPLASIRSAVEQLARMPQAGEDGRVLSGLIVRESDRLSRLLAEFLDFARVRVTRIAPVDLAAVARGATALARSHPDRDTGVTIECRTPAGAVMVEGDEDLLHRALFNLTLNAVQASPAGGTVQVEVALAEGDELNGDSLFDHGAVALRVTDSGPGIPADLRDQIFEPFTTTKPGGTGLGLSIVHRAIEAHHGFVFVDSDAGGARFTVLLPVRQEDADGALRAPSADASRPDGRRDPEDRLVAAARD
ncbi:MAG: two-component system sensor histidine kinase NtrB [Gemmatimonadaceae bacterium]